MTVTRSRLNADGEWEPALDWPEELASTLDWSEMCDVALALRKRIKPGCDRYILTDHEVTVLVCAALEYSNRLAHEEGRRAAISRAKQSGDTE